MKLITSVDPGSYPFRIGHRKDLMMMGSCFTENIGRLLERYLFPVTVNPFGTIYNPLSVKTGLEALLEKERYEAGNLEQHAGSWFSFDHDTGFSDPDKDRCLEKINGSFFHARDKLTHADVLVLSWGTSWVFRAKDSGRVVSNCHKIPAQRFHRFRLSVEEICSSYLKLLEALFAHNQDLKVLLTVSPVRHWKDGAHGNQLSKAVLLLAADELVRGFPGKVFYFPSYEIVMDELRDYRYYAEDMLHVSDQATRYIWEKFTACLVSAESREFIRDLEPLLKIRGHRPLDTGETAIRSLQQKAAKIQETLRSKYDFIDF